MTFVQCGNCRYAYATRTGGREGRGIWFQFFFGGGKGAFGAVCSCLVLSCREVARCWGSAHARGGYFAVGFCRAPLCVSSEGRNLEAFLMGKLVALPGLCNIVLFVM